MLAPTRTCTHKPERRQGPPPKMLRPVVEEVEVDRHTLRVYWQAPCVRLDAPGIPITGRWIDYAPHVALSGHLVCLPRRVVHFFKWVADVGALRWALSQCGQGHGAGLSTHLRDVVFGRDLDLDSHQKRTRNATDGRLTWGRP